ncbi:hypothetical protein A4H97_12730 [Niastella yeongjuensis]|uniref:Uncharacterized protein n=1 Tax=Niastella yeongjuensis TaxID=354355 RepID=A0A1V9EA81_9BACT|nr:hypothetical protein [Niastella yeongjuensis]OQP43006.1 hypothetical protein A4H97_12730 [Niastella yeongjuensis]SEO62985.1 hypothetical protein SAMN05660816_03215 [Niastella yeongjuensis]
MKKRTPLNRKRVLTDPVFEMSRQNSAEFSRACRANRLLRRALILGLRNKADRYISGRLTKTMFKILQSDPVSDRGERSVPKGVIGILKDFNFNRDTSLQNVLKAPYSIIINNEASRATISFPSIIPQAMIDTASGANAFMLSAMAASVNFEKETFPVEPVQTDILDLDLQRHENLQLQLPVIEHQPDNTVIVALGIEFFLNNRGSIEPVDKKHNALAVVKVF